MNGDISRPFILRAGQVCLDISHSNALFEKYLATWLSDVGHKRVLSRRDLILKSEDGQEPKR